MRNLQPFNSLSRDHLDQPGAGDIARSQRNFQLPLSGSHIDVKVVLKTRKNQYFQLPLSGSQVGSEGLKGRRADQELSTPSLGITKNEEGCHERRWAPFNSLSRDHSSKTIYHRADYRTLSTPSLGITVG